MDQVVDPTLAHATAARIQRRLVRRGIQDTPFAGEDVGRAIAVMDIEINDGDAFDGLCGERMGGTDGDVVEQAETHGGVGGGVMARRTHRAERATAGIGKHRIDGSADGTGRA